jgi:hypothetical protein
MNIVTGNDAKLQRIFSEILGNALATFILKPSR